MLFALWMIIFRLLPLSRQKMVHIHVKSGKLLLDPLDQTYRAGKVEIVESIINIVARASPTEIVTRLALLNKESNT